MAQAIRRNNIETIQARRKTRGALIRSIVNTALSFVTIAVFLGFCLFLQPITELARDAITGSVQVQAGK